jgi:hypothetical protein
MKNIQNMRLNIVLMPDVQEKFLSRMDWCAPGKKTVSFDGDDLMERREAIRAMCILLLLAKYQGGTPSNIPFLGSHWESTWMMTLFTLHNDAYADDFFKKFFQETKFFTAGRGSKPSAGSKKSPKGTPPSATFLQSLLPVRKVMLYELLPDGSEKLLEGEQLAQKALELEKSGKWDNHEVPQVLAAIRKLPGDDEVKPSSAMLTESWMDLIEFRGEHGERLRQRLDAPNIGETWHVVTIAPLGFLAWMNRFRDAVEKHEVTVKWVYHSPAAVAESQTVRSQWEMLHDYATDKKLVLSDGVRLLTGQRDELARWERSAKESAKREGKKFGKYEFYESWIAHYYMAFMAVPPGMTDFGPGAVAPPGTVCMLQLYPMFPDNLASRVGLYLESPSPLLDVYYRSILRFINDDPKRGYLKQVDAENLAPQRKPGREAA